MFEKVVTPSPSPAARLSVEEIHLTIPPPARAECVHDAREYGPGQTLVVHVDLPASLRERVPASAPFVPNVMGEPFPYSLERKDEFHLTVIGKELAKELAELHTLNPSGFDVARAAIVTFAESVQVRLTGELFSLWTAKSNGQHAQSVIAGAHSEQFVALHVTLGEILKRGSVIPYPHVTLMVGGDPHGIGIATSYPAHRVHPEPLSLDALSTGSITAGVRAATEVLPFAVRARLFDALLSEDPEQEIRNLKANGFFKKWLPRLDALSTVPQDRIHHAEGDVWEHTLRVLSETVKTPAGTLADGNRDAVLALRLGALLHDIGKGLVTEIREAEGTSKDVRLTAIGHEKAGVLLAEAYLHRLGIEPNSQVFRDVITVVEHHMIVPAWQRELNKANRAEVPFSAKQVRELLEKLNGTDLELYLAACRADQLGRETLAEDTKQKLNLLPTVELFESKVRAQYAAICKEVEARRIELAKPQSYWDGLMVNTMAGKLTGRIRQALRALPDHQLPTNEVELKTFVETWLEENAGTK